MKALRTGGYPAIGCGAAIALLLFPVLAPAKVPVSTAGSEAEPGVTVTGLGFARTGPVARAGREARQRPVDAAHPTAVARAVRDARRRAKAIAGALRVQAGPPLEVDLRQIGQFGQRRPCRRRAEENRRDCRPPGLTAAAATVTFSIVGGADGSTASGTVGADGAASVAIRPADRSRNQPIKREVLAVRRQATPQAASVAWRNASKVARSAGLKLGGLISISEAATPFYFGSGFYDPALGSFGPGRFCGMVNRPVVKRDPETGAPKVVRRVRERRCRPGSSYQVSLAIKYEAG